MVDQRFVDKAAKAVADSQNVPFVGSKQERIARAVLDAVAEDLRADLIAGIRAAVRRVDIHTPEASLGRLLDDVGDLIDMTGGA